MACRIVVVCLLVLAMAGTHKILKNDDLNVLFLLDQSRSVSPELRDRAEQMIRVACRDMRPRDRASILTFDGVTSIQQLPSRPGPDDSRTDPSANTGLHVDVPFADGQQPDRTNIAQGLRMAAACVLESTNNRVVLISDGNENIGDLSEEVKAAQANEITVDVVPLRMQRGAEVIVEQLRVPAYANLHEQIPLRLIVRSDIRTTGIVRIYQRVGENEELIDISPNAEDPGQRVELAPGRNAFTVRLPIKVARIHEFRAEFVPDDNAADVLPQNNQARAFTAIEGPKTVLFIGTQRDRDDDELLVRALAKEDITVDWVAADSVNLTTSALQDYAAIVLANVPAEYFDATQQRALATYVSDLGGGLVMIGGDESFAAGGWQGSVVEDIMPIKFDVDAVKQIPRGALAIVVHSCEMPNGNKWGIEVAVAALKTLSRLDYFGVVGWSYLGTDWEVPMQLATNKDQIIQQIRKMQNGDMPDFHSSMDLAYKGLINCKDAAQRHMIIISDGDATPPGSSILKNLVGRRITCSTVSVFPHRGSTGTMKRIADVTKGRHHLLNKPGDEKRLPKIFIKEARIVRRPLIRDEIFKPVIKPNLSDIMVGIGRDLPELRGYVVTTPRKVVDVEMPLVTKRGDPLLAHWHCGCGRTVAFTSGRWKHWGADWPEWSGFSKLWSQAVRWAMQQGSAANYDVTTTIQGDEGHIVIESMDDQQSFANFRGFRGRVISPDSTAKELSIVQTGPGRYEGKFKVGQMGTYLAHIQTDDPTTDAPVAIRTGVTIAYSPEFKDLVLNESLLREVADVTGGRVLSTDADNKTVFAHNLPPTISRKPIWDMLFKLAVFMFLLDVAVRRIAFDPAKVWAMTRGHIASLAGRFGAGKRAEATLTDLKTVRDKVRAERTAEGDVEGLQMKPGAGPPIEEPVLATDAKFEAEKAQLKKPSRPLTDALGGPTAPGQAGSTPTAKPAKPTKEGPKESTTARLLKAKRRAKEQREDEN